MSRKKSEEQRVFTRSLEERNRLLMDNIRRAWKQKLDEVDRCKSTVDIQYESIQTRLERITADVEMKTIAVREKSKKLKEDIITLRKQIGRAKASIELRESDESSEVDVELRLKMQADELKDRLTRTNSKVVKLNNKMLTYKDMYQKMINKQRKIKERRNIENDLKFTRNDLNSMLQEFKKKISQEHINLDEDLKKLREMRENLIHPPPPKRSPQEEYRKYLMEAGQWVDEHQQSFMKTDENVVYINEHDSNDSDIPVHSHFSNISPNVLDDSTLDQIEFLENNIRTLLSTGNYKEDDPLIAGMKKQIEDLRTHK